MSASAAVMDVILGTTKTTQNLGQFVSRGIDETLGELTGDNLARRKAAQKRDMEAAQAAQQAEIDSAVNEKKNADLAASNAAGQLRDKATSTLNSKTTVAPDRMLTKEFLGL